jgi:TonB family protein
MDLQPVRLAEFYSAESKNSGESPRRRVPCSKRSCQQLLGHVNGSEDLPQRRMRVFIFSVAIAILGLSQAHAAQKSGMVNARAAWFMPAKEFQAQIDAQTKPSQCDVPPKVWRAISPAYPPSRRSRGESGYALVEFTINERGRTCDIRVLETSFKYFGNYAVLAIQDWRFRPALKNGHPVPVHIRIPFHYRMKA